MYRSIETYRGVVYPWSVDHVGHMNVQFYTARFDEASWQLLGHLGTLLHVTTELLEVGRRSVRFIHRM